MKILGIDETNKEALHKKNVCLKLLNRKRNSELENIRKNQTTVEMNQEDTTISVQFYPPSKVLSNLGYRIALVQTVTLMTMRRKNQGFCIIIMIWRNWRVLAILNTLPIR